jgi:hypothetical protein
VIYLAIKNDCKRKKKEDKPESIPAKEDEPESILAKRKKPESTPAEKPDNILTKLCYYYN